MGLALLVLAFADQPPGLIWGLELYELILGRGCLPRGDGGRRSSGTAVRRWRAALHGCGGHGSELLIIALFANPYTAGAAALFYGMTLLVAAWRGQPDCEATVLSNLILGRDDQIGCPTFTPIDAFEARRSR